MPFSNPERVDPTLPLFVETPSLTCYNSDDGSDRLHKFHNYQTYAQRGRS